MDKRLFVMLLIVSVIAGCSYVYTGNTECEPPAIAMSDINGNTVCVITSDSQAESVTSQTEPTRPIEEQEEITIDISPGTDGIGPIFDVDRQEPITEAPTEEETDSEPIMEDIEDVQSEPVVRPEPIDTAGLPRKVVKAGELVDFPNLKAVDPEGENVTYTFTSPLDRNGEWQTTEDDVGEYIVTITASDGVNDVSQRVVIVVEGANRPPVISPIPNIEVMEGDLVKVSPRVSDPDGDEVTITFQTPLDDEGEWQTEEGDAGSYIVGITASDGQATTETAVAIRVNPMNNPPVMERIEDIMVKEGDTVVIRPVVTDPDGDEVRITYSGWMTSARYTTDYDDAGEHIVVVTATDGKDSVTQRVLVIVEEINRPPEFDPSAFI